MDDITTSFTQLVSNFYTKDCFQTKTLDKIDGAINQLKLLMGTPRGSFNFILCQEFKKTYFQMKLDQFHVVL